MYCQQCGAAILDNTRFCPSCGEDQSRQNQTGLSPASGQLVGYSDRINDPRIAAVMKKINSSGTVFMFILAVVAFIGFTIAGMAEVGGFELPSALYIGLGIGGLLVVIGLIQKAKAKSDKTWDGTVVDKKIKQPTYSQRKSGDYQTQYALYINDQFGNTRKLPCTEDYFNYMQIGEQVRHHGGTPKHIFEKYDKSHDSIVYCIACTSKNNICDELCHRCKCPLLK
jgi:hypothetical protein